jgi:hypothetical protein
LDTISLPIAVSLFLVIGLIATRVSEPAQQISVD